MFYDGKKLKAVLPASINGNVLASHGGLSFGGLVLGFKTKTTTIVDIFKSLLIFARENGIDKIIYKNVPHIYHLYPAEADLYAMYLMDAKLVKRNPSAVIKMEDKLGFQSLRKRSLKKAAAKGVVVREVDDYKLYWDILTDNLLNKHSVTPTHSLEEIEYLKSLFPENIKLFASYMKGSLLAGVVMYENKTVTRAQYIAASLEGRDVGALDIIFDYLINAYYKDIDYFDFGVSTETFLVDGKYVLNEGLIFQKEGFGARSIVYDIYEIEVC
jgi:hypothetical protein